MEAAEFRVRTNHAVSSQGTPLQWIWMNELRAMRRTQTALGDCFRLQEPAHFSIARVGPTGLVIAERLPLRQVVQLQLGFELVEVGQCWTFGETAPDKLCAGFLHTHSIGCVLI